MALNYKIIFEDDSIAVIDKPAGLLSIPGRYESGGANLKSLLQDKYAEIYTVHRLDRDTSGIMVFAKTAKAHKYLNDQFFNNEVEKFYHAVVKGIISSDEMEIDIPLKPDPAIKGASAPSARGKESLTILKVLERYRIATLTECRLVTGRHHQLRVHVAAIGHPLLVDKLYGGEEAFFLSSIKKKFNIGREKEERPTITRISMHAYSIGFKHPDSGELIKFSAPYPKDLEVMVQLLSKYASMPDHFSPGP